MHFIGDNHAELHQHRNVIADRNGLRTGRPVRHNPWSRRVRQSRNLGTRKRRLPGSRKRSTSWTAPSHRTGTQLADERESMLWGFVNALHAQVQRLDRGIDKIAPEMKDLGQEQDGSEIKSRELELLTDRVQNLGDRRDAFETMRDLAAEGYCAETGDTWRPRNGSHSSQTGKLTSADIDARDYLRAREHRETSAHLPQGTLVAFTGGKEFDDVTAIWRSLDSIKIKYHNMVLLHGGGPGAEKIAASWAEKNGVHQVVCKPDWGRDGKAAPFRRNDLLLNFLPKGLVAFPGSASLTTWSTRPARSESPSCSPPRNGTLRGPVPATTRRGTGPLFMPVG